jgi:hypothetical protein
MQVTEMQMCDTSATLLSRNVLVEGGFDLDSIWLRQKSWVQLDAARGAGHGPGCLPTHLNSAEKRGR